MNKYKLKKKNLFDRHHDIIPWDDDVDVLFNFKDRFLLLEYLPKIKEILPETLIEKAGMRIKLSDERGVKYSNLGSEFSYRWPYVDIEFFEGKILYNQEQIYTFIYSICKFVCFFLSSFFK